MRTREVNAEGYERVAPISFALGDLKVGHHARRHRGRSRLAGCRGIAVGLPEKINYALNAETETLFATWQGACYPFREGLSTGILNVGFTPGGNLVCGGAIEVTYCWPI